MDQAEEWDTGIVAAYTAAEVHSIKGSPGDIANVGVFFVNADKTVFEFLESFELGYIDWGNNCQRASKLLKHLSSDLKDKVMSQSDNYALMHKWLISNYGAPARIVNDTVMALVKRKLLIASDQANLYAHVSAIIAGLQRLEKLSRTNIFLAPELIDCLHSRNTLTSLSHLLIPQDYDEYIKEMTRRSLDWRNQLGKETYECIRYICTMEKNMLEASCDNGGFLAPKFIQPATNSGIGPSKGKSKGVFATFDESDPDSDGEPVVDGANAVLATVGNSDWIKPGSNFQVEIPMSYAGSQS